MEDRFNEIKKFVEVMSKEFHPVGVMKIKIKDAEWLVSEVEKLRNELKK